MSPRKHQASCVAIGGRALLIEGLPGSGKSSLSLALIDRGATLVGDDGVLLEQRKGRLWASPVPEIAGLIEIRNVGLLRLPTAAAPVALLLSLDPEAPRHLDHVPSVERLGATLPLIRLWPGASALHLRAERALEMHGLV